MIYRFAAAALAAASTAVASPAAATEVYGAIYDHEAAPPWTNGAQTGEHGFDLQAGVRFAPVLLEAQPYVFASVNTSGDTNMVGAGLSWHIGSKFYLRPGFGIVLHDGPVNRPGHNGMRSDLGSRVLGQIELSAGARVNERLSLEVSWMHTSQASIFSNHNPGLDMLGVRLNMDI
jgi:lipid A 3-O-deacylase